MQRYHVNHNSGVEDCRVAREPINNSCGAGQLLNCHNNSQPYGFFHTGGLSVAFADGSVHFMDEQLDPEAFVVSLFTLASGDTGQL